MSRIRHRRGKEKDSKTTAAEDVLVVRDALNGTPKMSTVKPPVVEESDERLPVTSSSSSCSFFYAGGQ
ncbi:hypothetical protein F2Q70_00036898 [Brassica cretica]|uniref:Uncharacterized protein n=2 Tax=Brassica cretica TaxID=69181 RepID=A0A8S9JVN1_BRACR|nr:hypothetical protein F2Q68_00029726 [Brassica cretica]KAF2585486.1 hypothetical protein F2Q70_00036898 [Brassica cretica]KAF3529768.1 hypothetical protein DY000_02042227 [Brassica cretica]